MSSSIGLPACVRVFFFGFLLTPALLGQNYHGIATQEPWSEELSGGSFKGVVSGRFSDDAMLDAVVQVGNQLVLLTDPAQQTFFSPFGGETIDFVRWPGAPTDRVIASEPARIAVYSWNGGTGTLDIGTPLTGPFPATLGLELEIDPVDGIPRLAGLEADGMTFFIGSLQDGCSGGCYTEEGRFPISLDVGETVSSFEILQWDGAGGLEFLVHTTSELHLLSSTGTPLVSPIPVPATRSIIERFHDAGLARDRAVFFFGGLPAGEFFGAVIDNRYPVLEPPLLFGPITIGQIGFFDYDGDGWTDLWAPLDQTAEAFLLYGAVSPMFPSESTFEADLEQTTVIPLAPLDPPEGIPSSTASIGDTGDFDLDGDVDFLFVSDDFQHVNFLRGDTYNEDFRIPHLDYASFMKATTGGQTTFSYGLEVRIPYPTYPREANEVSTIKKLTVEVFYQPEFGAAVEPLPRAFVTTPLVEGSTPMDQVKYGRAPSPPSFPPGGGEHEVDDFGGPSGGSPGIGSLVNVPVSFGVTGDQTGAVYQFRFRLLGAADEQIGPALIEYFSDDEGTSQQLEVENSPWLEPDNGFGFHRRGGVGRICWPCF